ncbi:MAG TPA: uracil-DNA glycosylase [Polyangiaceae bacterium]
MHVPPLHVPLDPYVTTDVALVHEAAGGVLHATALHGSAPWQAPSAHASALASAAASAWMVVDAASEVEAEAPSEAEADAASEMEVEAASEAGAPASPLGAAGDPAEHPVASTTAGATNQMSWGCMVGRTERRTPVLPGAAFANAPIVVAFAPPPAERQNGAMLPGSLPLIQQRIVSCRACPRLVAWREEVARVKVTRFRAWDYWGKPVPGFGDPRARLLVVGLAPGAHGANRTGRVFTGDRSGDFLYAALHRAGFASQPASTSRDDGLTLEDAFVLTPVRCAPPGNAPRPDEIARCAHWLDEETALLPRVRVVLALGAIAWRAVLDAHERAGGVVPRPRPAFGHGARKRLAGGADEAEAAGATTWEWLLGSYHVSQQNTQTGKLTPAMFDAVLADARSVLAAKR